MGELVRGDEAAERLVLVVDADRGMRFRLPRPADFHGSRNGHGREEVHGCVLAVSRLDGIEGSPEGLCELGQVVATSHDVVVGTRGRDRPDWSIGTEGLGDPVVRDPRADLKLEGHRPARCSGRRDGEGHRGGRVLPPPAFRVPEKLSDLRSGNIREQAPELHEQRHRGHAEHGETLDLLSFQTPSHLLGEGLSQVAQVGSPVVRVMVGQAQADHVEVDPAAIRRVQVREHGRLHVLGGDMGFIRGDACRVADHVACAILVDARHDLDAPLMTGLHRAEAFHGVVLPRLRSVDEAMVGIAHQHQVGGVVGELRRKDRIATRAVRTVGDDVGDVGLVQVRLPGDEVADEALVAPVELAPPGGLAPDDCLDVCRECLAGGPGRFGGGP